MISKDVIEKVNIKPIHSKRLVGFLLLSGCRLVDVEKDEKSESKFIFNFKNSEKTNDKIRAYFGNTSVTKREVNIITIDDLEYETLNEIYDGQFIYETDRIIVKQKKFSEQEIEEALMNHTKLLAQVYDNSFDIGEDGIEMNNRGSIIELLSEMLGDDYDDPDMSTSIQEAIMHRQWQTEGLRRYCTWNGKEDKPLRYFNPEAEIEIVYID
ncbi:hypothetical protein FYJ38_24435 [Clostridium sp. WB02_MRS01]|uniref:DUF5659 domain-containing protein n=1 Tax=Clostridium sp. WB02_MRS01 TaxID=2605777 RepID=UPI0012B28872|nr:DUF5659 domain-containing protein [Clostridium sp. WB02_MRS01]MSS11758.1 hypothetical protein [Clostridium sp. WB02_MRS01]